MPTKRRRLEFDVEEIFEEDSDNEANSDRFTKALVEFVAATDQSLSIVDSKYFRNLFTSIGSKVKIPCRKTFTQRLLRNYYTNMKNDIILSLESKKEKVMCITTDSWSNSNNETFLGLTVHYVNDDYFLAHHTISLKYLSGSHTSVYISETIKEILSEWKIKDFVKFGCSDNGANFSRALEFLDFLTPIPCSCHCLNLCVEDILLPKEPLESSDKFVKDLLSKCKKFVSAFRHSYLLTEALKNKQITMNWQCKTKLVQDVPTRWNSTYDMLQSLIKNQVPLDSIVQEASTNSSIKSNYPSNQEFLYIDALLKLLKPLKELTVELSAYNYSCCSIIYPSIYGLIEQLKNLSFTYHEVNILKSRLISSLESRFDHVLNGYLSDLFISLTFLDIRFKNFEFVKSDREREMLKKRAEMYIKKYFYENISNNLSQPSNSVNQINNTQNDQNKTSFIKSLMDSRVNSSRNNLLEDEIYRYSNMDVNEYYDDPLEFFRINKSSFPLLCKIVNIYSA